VFQALAAVAVPAKMAAGRRRLLLAASLGTGAGKQVTGKVLSSTARLRRPILSCPHIKVDLCVSDGGFMVHVSTGHGG
jgi:hypothetical protein